LISQTLCTNLYKALGKLRKEKTRRRTVSLNIELGRKGQAFLSIIRLLAEAVRRKTATETLHTKASAEMPHGDKVVRIAKVEVQANATPV
jgi:hypothetical protein